MIPHESHVGTNGSAKCTVQTSQLASTGDAAETCPLIVQTLRSLRRRAVDEDVRRVFVCNHRLVSSQLADIIPPEM